MVLLTNTNNSLAFYCAELKLEISDYLSRIRSKSGLLSDLEYYLEKTLTLLEKPSVSLKRLKSIALQIQGQFTLQPETASSLQHSFLCDYIKFRQHPPRRVLDLCQKILELSE